MIFDVFGLDPRCSVFGRTGTARPHGTYTARGPRPATIMCGCRSGSNRTPACKSKNGRLRGCKVPVSRLLPAHRQIHPRLGLEDEAVDVLAISLCVRGSRHHRYRASSRSIRPCRWSCRRSRAPIVRHAHRLLPQMASAAWRCRRTLAQIFFRCRTAHGLVSHPSVRAMIFRPCRRPFIIFLFRSSEGIAPAEDDPSHNGPFSAAGAGFLGRMILHQRVDWQPASIRQARPADHAASPSERGAHRLHHACGMVEQVAVEGPVAGLVR